MKTGEAGSLLGVTSQTIVNWIQQPILTRFFSESAQQKHGGTQRILTESDVLVLNTIRHLRTTGTDAWKDIETYLDSGQRYQEFPQNAVSNDTRTIPMPQAEQSVRAAATSVERDGALARVKELESEVARLRLEHKEEITQIRAEREQTKEENRQFREENKQLSQRVEMLLREIAEMNRQLGRFEGQLGTREEKG